MPGNINPEKTYKRSRCYDKDYQMLNFAVLIIRQQEFSIFVFHRKGEYYAGV